MNQELTPNSIDPTSWSFEAKELRAAFGAGMGFVWLYIAQAVFIPIALALLFALVLPSPVEALHRKGLPHSVSACLILVVVLGRMGVAVDKVWAPAKH